jgi:hypothetical protein
VTVYAGVPLRNQVKCEGCGETIDCTANGNAQHAEGWVVNRPTSKGGTNGVTFLERHRRWLCRWCIDKRRAGVPFEQESLF